MWRKYKAKKCDLHTAAVTTNAAFDLVRQAEEDLVAQAPAVLDKKRSYDSIAMIVFQADLNKLDPRDPDQRVPQIQDNLSCNTP